MWIFDSYRRGCVELWGKEHGLSRVCIGYPPSFYLHLKDPHAHVDMIEALEGRYRVEDAASGPFFGEPLERSIGATWKGCRMRMCGSWPFIAE